VKTAIYSGGQRRCQEILSHCTGLCSFPSYIYISVCFMLCFFRIMHGSFSIPYGSFHILQGSISILYGSFHILQGSFSFTYGSFNILQGSFSILYGSHLECAQIYLLYASHVIHVYTNMYMKNAKECV